jgi:hypothetical protein
MELIMPANFFKFSPRSLLAGLAVALTTTACAPDNFQLGKSKQLDTYLDKIAKNCGAMYINQFQVWVLALDESADPGYQDYFIDQASMLLYGTTTPEQYIADMSGYFDDMSPRGMKTYQCIIAQLPDKAPALPKAYREVMKAAPQVSGND